MPTKKKPNAKMGRPTLYKPEYCERLVKWCKRGFSYESFGADVDVATHTLYDWEKAHPEFLQAKKKALTYSRAWWENAGIEGLAAEKFNASVWIFNMKNRFGWRDKQPEEVADDSGAIAKRIAERVRALTD